MVITTGLQKFDRRFDSYSQGMSARTGGRRNKYEKDIIHLNNIYDEKDE